MSETETIDVVEILEPSAQIYTVVLENRTFVQKPLSFFGKIEFFSVLGEAVEKALAGGTTVSDLLESPGALSNVGIGEADAFIGAISKVARVAPNLLENVFCISLRVHSSEREEVKELLREMEDEQGNAILNQFFDQNFEAMVDFFEAQNSLVKKVSVRMQSRSTSSKQSKATRTRTRKQ